MPTSLLVGRCGRLTMPDRDISRAESPCPRVEDGASGHVGEGQREDLVRWSNAEVLRHERVPDVPAVQLASPDGGGDGRARIERGRRVALRLEVLVFLVVVVLELVILVAFVFV